MPDPPTLVEWIVQAGPLGFAIVFAFLWQLERKEKLVAQADATTLRNDAIKQAGDSVKALTEYGVGVQQALIEQRNALKEHDERIDRVLAEAERRRGGVR